MTIVALSTPSGQSAIAMIRISGTECKALVRDLFNDVNLRPRRNIHSKYVSANGELIDDVVYCYYEGPASYTGEDMIEICTHGNQFIVQNILQDLFDRGIKSAQAGEFTQRAFLNDKLDLSQAEAVSLLINAQSKVSLNAAHKQLSGSLANKINDLNSVLIDICAQIEAYIDFPDEDLPQEDKENIYKKTKDILAEMDKLIATSKYTALIHQGLNMTILGQPNAGKSSLMNLLLGENRAIVSQIAGTTRDFIKEKIIIGQYSINLFDTAGIHVSSDEIENFGINMAIERAQKSDIALLTIDSSNSELSLPDEIYAKISPHNTIVVLNKCDISTPNMQIHKDKFKAYKQVEISCKDNLGLRTLHHEVLDLIKQNQICPDSDDILVSARHAQSLKESADAINEAVLKIENSDASELIVADLYSALDALGQIVGKTDNEAILDRVFSKFCIGK